MEQPSKLQLKQFSAYVRVEGKSLECYSTWVNQGDRHVTCWIASEVGKVWLTSCGILVFTAGVSRTLT